MCRVAIVLLLLAGLLRPAGASPAEPAGLGAVSPASRAVYRLAFNLRAASAFPRGSTIVCRAQIAPGLRGESNFHGAQDGPGMAAATAAVTGSTATCAVEVPAVWTAGIAARGVLLRYEIVAFDGGGIGRMLVQDAGWVEAGASPPGDGAMMQLVFNLAVSAR